MAVEFKILDVDTPTGAESTTQDYTSSGFGTPDVAIVDFVLTTSTLNPRDLLVASRGIVTSSAQAVIGSRSDNNASTSNTARAHATDKCVGHFSAFSLAWSRSGSGSLITDGLRITFTSVYTNASPLRIILIKGLSNVDLLTTQITSTGVNNITSVGFQPHLIMCLSAGTSSLSNGSTNVVPNGFFHTGFCHVDSTDTITQFCSTLFDRDVVSTTEVSQIIRNNAIASQVANNAEQYYGSVEDPDFQGFSVNFTANPNDYFTFLSIQVDDADDIDIGIIDTPTSTGITSTYSTGFQPNALLLLQTSLQTVNSIFTSGSNIGGFGFGFHDGTDETCSCTATQDNVGTSNTQINSSDANIMQLYEGDNTLMFEGTFDTYQSDGFRLNFTTTDATARKFGYVAFKEPVTGSVGSSIGSAVTSFVGAAIFSAALSSSGVGALSATGASIFDSTLSSAGQAVVSGVGASENFQDGVLSSTGLSTTNYVGDSLSSTQFDAAGLAVGSFFTSSLFSSVGQATVSGVGDSTISGEAVGSSDGVAATNFIGASLSDSTLSSIGIATINGIGNAVVESVISSTGVATVNGVGSSATGSDWSATGQAVGTFVGASIHDSVLASTGQSTVNGVGSAAGVIESVWSASGSAISLWASPDVFEDGIWSTEGSSRLFAVSGFICSPSPPEPFSCKNKTFRSIHQRALRTIYNRLGALIEYHSQTGGIGQYCGIFSTEPEFAPDGYATSVQEDEVIYFFRREELINPQVGDYIVDEGQRYDVLRRERKGRFEWLLVVREILT